MFIKKACVYKIETYVDMQIQGEKSYDGLSQITGLRDWTIKSTKKLRRFSIEIKGWAVVCVP